VLAHAGKQGRRVVSAFIGTAFAQDDAEAAKAPVATSRRLVAPEGQEVAELMDEAESDVLALHELPASAPPQVTLDESD